MGDNVTKTLYLSLYSDSYNNYVDANVNQGLNAYKGRKACLKSVKQKSPKKHILLFFALHSTVNFLLSSMNE